MVRLESDAAGEYYSVATAGRFVESFTIKSAALGEGADFSFQNGTLSRISRPKRHVATGRRNEN